MHHRQRSGAITDIAKGLLELDKQCEEDDRRRRIVKLISENVTKLREEGVEQAMQLLIGTAKNRLRLGLIPDLIFHKLSNWLWTYTGTIYYPQKSGAYKL